MSKTKEEYEKLKQIRINNMLKWTEEDYIFYRAFFKEVRRCKKAPRAPKGGIS